MGSKKGESRRAEENLSSDEVGQLIHEIGEYIDHTIGTHDQVQVQDALDACVRIAERHSFDHCPEPVPGHIATIFDECDTSRDQWVTRAEFDECVKYSRKLDADADGDDVQEIGADSKAWFGDFVNLDER